MLNRSTIVRTVDAQLIFISRNFLHRGPIIPPLIISKCKEQGDGINRSIIARDEVEFEVHRVEKRRASRGSTKWTASLDRFPRVLCICGLCLVTDGTIGDTFTRHDHGEIRSPVSREGPPPPPTPSVICAGFVRACVCDCVIACNAYIYTCERERMCVVTKCSRTGCKTMRIPELCPRNSRAPNDFLPPVSRSRYGCKAYAAVKVLYLAVTEILRAFFSSRKQWAFFFFFFFRHDSTY